MRFDIDSGKLLYALGIAFAAAALLYFARDVVFDLSITVKAVLLFVAFVTFVLGGVTLQRDVLDVVAFALAGVTYVVFVGYVVLRYGPSETGTFLLLALSAGLFVALGYGLRQGKLTVNRQQATTVAAALLVLSVALVGLDALGGDVTYDFETAQSVTVDPVAADEPAPYVERSVRIGTMRAVRAYRNDDRDERLCLHSRALAPVPTGLSGRRRERLAERRVGVVRLPKRHPARHHRWRDDPCVQRSSRRPSRRQPHRCGGVQHRTRQ